jgi:imidazolonepropionase-like amidohydrolase
MSLVSSLPPTIRPAMGGKMRSLVRWPVWIAIAAASSLLSAASAARAGSLREVNQVPSPSSTKTVAIVGAMLIDGRGGPPLQNATVIVRGERIAAVGPRGSVAVPDGAELVDATGLTLLPGLIDSHFHLEGANLPTLMLRHGVTSVRDPGQWIEAYDDVRKGAGPTPRLFLCGPHLDTPPPAYPADSYIARDPDEARLAVNRFIDQGASAIKVYFRLPLGLIKVVTQTAHARGVPVTAHLEIVDAADAIRAGIDGVEHVTSFGTALLPPREAEKYRQSVLADNSARREGRYQVWSTLDLDSQRARGLIELIVQKRTFISATLAVFERRAGDRNTTDVHVKAFLNMMGFVGRARKAGARVVVGSHSTVPHAQPGWAYQREMELLVEGGLTPMQAIVAGTLDNARFFRIEKRLGSIEAGKLADLVLIDGDPLQHISAMRRVKRVMLNGVWVPATP